ncbi:MAG: uncharacterized protein QOF48_3127 [Verrucomicrobiota bacterium]|jgi:hypothetical protein
MTSDRQNKSASKAGKTSREPNAPESKPAAKAAKTARKAAIPPILLEGDETPAPPQSGPGVRFALGAASPAPPGLEPGELPEDYGTQRLLLTARDPRWLYAHWDFSTEQLRRYNARSVDRHLVLRIYKNLVGGQPHREVHVHPESRNWFANVADGGASYIAELGYYRPGEQWISVATSGTTMTPPDNLSDDTAVWFATLPVDLRSEELLGVIKSALRANVPLAEAVQQLRAAGGIGLPEPGSLAAGRWTPEQERTLAQLVSIDSVRRVWIGSLEVTELLRRQLMHELSSMALSQFSLPSSWSGAVSSFSSPLGGMERQKGFWFNVNAELIIYGATEPTASVTIGGRQIRLRPDGSFSYRFALPDGNYDLPAIATSADGTDSRSAGLTFARATAYQGDVGRHPQDPALKPPLAANVS